MCARMCGTVVCACGPVYVSVGGVYGHSQSLITMCLCDSGCGLSSPSALFAFQDGDADSWEKLTQGELGPSS